SRDWSSDVCSSDLNQPVRSRREPGDFKTLALQLMAGVYHRLVLDHGGDDMSSAFGPGMGCALYRQVVGLGRAGGPDDLSGIGPDQIGHLAARQLDRLLRLPAILV